MSVTVINALSSDLTVKIIFVIVRIRKYETAYGKKNIAGNIQQG